MEVLHPHNLGIELISDSPPVAAVLPPPVDEVMINPAVFVMGPTDS